jgi:hypothetical protein
LDLALAAQRATGQRLAGDVNQAKAHARQKVWPHASVTGSVNTSLQTLHSRSGGGGVTHTHAGGSRSRRRDICASGLGTPGRQKHANRTRGDVVREEASGYSCCHVARVVVSSRHQVTRK